MKYEILENGAYTLPLGSTVDQAGLGRISCSAQGVCSRTLYCKVHDYLKSKDDNSSLKWMKIAASKYRGRLV